MRAFMLFAIILFIVTCTRPESSINPIQEMEYTRQLDSSLCDSALKGEKAERLILARALAHMETGEKYLFALAQDKNVTVQKWAAFGLGKTVDSTAFSRLVNLISDIRTDTVRAILIEAVGKSGGQPAAAFLIDLLKKEREALLREAALKGLMWLALSRGSSIFTAEQMIFLREFKPLNKQEAFRHCTVLYRLADTSFLKPLLGYANNGDPVTAHFALRGMYRLVNHNNFYRLPAHLRAAILKSVRENIHDTHWQKQIAALPFFEVEPNLLKYNELHEVVKQAHPYVRQTFLLNVLNKNLPHFQQYLDSLLHSKDVHIAGAAYVALAKINPQKAFGQFPKRLSIKSKPSAYYTMEAASYFTEKHIQKIKTLMENTTDIYIRFRWYEIVAEKKMMDEAVAKRALALNDMAVTTTVAMALKKDSAVWIPTVLIPAFKKLTMPRDVEPMTAILQTLDGFNSPEVHTFFKGVVQHNPDLCRLNKNLKHFSGLSLPATKEPALKHNFPVNARSAQYMVVKTERGDFKIELFPEIAPNTIANMLTLAEKGYFNGLFFHRVVPGFVIQGGDPRGDGWGGPGYAIPCEYSFLPYETGMVGIATAGKDTGGSQFFVSQMPTPHLDGRYTIWGKVSTGMQVVNSIMPYDKIYTIEIH